MIPSLLQQLSSVIAEFVDLVRVLRELSTKIKKYYIELPKKNDVLDPTQFPENKNMELRLKLFFVSVLQV